MSNFGKAKKEAINALKMKSILNDHNNTTVKEMSNAQKTAKDILESGKGIVKLGLVFHASTK